MTLQQLLQELELNKQIYEDNVLQYKHSQNIPDMIDFFFSHLQTVLDSFELELTTTVSAQSARYATNGKRDKDKASTNGQSSNGRASTGNTGSGNSSAGNRAAGNSSNGNSSQGNRRVVRQFSTPPSGAVDPGLHICSFNLRGPGECKTPTCSRHHGKPKNTAERALRSYLGPKLNPDRQTLLQAFYAR